MDPSSLTARLRELVRGTAPRCLPELEARSPAPRRDAAPFFVASGFSQTIEEAAGKFGGHVEDDVDGPCIVVERDYPSSARHGHALMRDWAAAAGDAARHLELTRTLRPRIDRPLLSSDDEIPSSVPGGCCVSGGAPLLFFDLETTGLAGGAGTHAFLVGCGWFEGDSFRTRQLFLTGFEFERALLARTGGLFASGGALVSFNGKTFDIPLIETRYLFHRMALPFAGRPHFDMLHPARRLWRRESCALTTLERDLFGVWRHDDVPGYEIPARYFHYIRSGDATSLVPVLEHNRLDLLSLAGLVVRAAHILAEGAPATRDARECFGLGRLYDRSGISERAVACYERAASRARRHEEDIRLEALRRLALLFRRARRYGEAAAVWEQLLASGAASPATGREAIQALAVYHEHRSRDLLQARLFTLRALQAERAAERLEAVRYRLARLERKLGRGSI